MSLVTNFDGIKAAVALVSSSREQNLVACCEHLRPVVCVSPMLCNRPNGYYRRSTLSLFMFSEWKHLKWAVGMLERTVYLETTA